MSSDQWAALAIDNGRLLTEARMKLAAVERERDQLAAQLSETAVELLEESIAWLKLDGRWARAIRWAWSFRRRLQEKTWEADGWRIKVSGTAKQLAAATARERAARERGGVLESTLRVFANREHWLERSDGRLVWIGTTDAPDLLTARVLGEES